MLRQIKGLNMKIQNLLILSVSVIFLGACNNTVTGTTGNNSSSISITNNKINDCSVEVGKVKLTNSANKTSFSTDIITPASFSHNYKVITIDASEFTNGGTINVSGTVGTDKASASFGLLALNSDFSCSGFQANTLGGSANVKPGSSFNFSYKFSSGQTFRLGSEGSWDEAKDSKNTINLNISIN